MKDKIILTVETNTKKQTTELPFDTNLEGFLDQFINMMRFVTFTEDTIRDGIIELAEELKEIRDEHI